MKNRYSMELEYKIKACGKFGDFTLTSGKKSDFYMNIKSLLLQANTIAALGHILYKEINRKWGLSICAVGGFELGSVPISSAIAHSSCLGAGALYDQFIVRKQPRTHGTKSQIEGIEIIQDKNVLIVDDVLTTGGTILKCKEVLEKEGVNVVGALVIFDRQDIDISTLPVPVHALFNRKEVFG